MAIVSRMNRIIAIAVVCAMVFGSFSVLGSTVTKFSSSGSSEANVVFPDGGGSSSATTITMPAIAVAMGSKLMISSGPVNDTHFTDYRKEKDYRMHYSGNYYHNFPPLASQYSPAEMTVTTNGATLRYYAGNYTPAFGDWGFIDNATTTANYLVDDGYDSRIVPGVDNTKTNYVPGPTVNDYDCAGCYSASKKSGSASRTYFPDGRMFKSINVLADYYSYPYYYYAPSIDVKAWNINTQGWDKLVDNLALPYAAGTYTGYSVYTSPASWTTSPRYTQIQVKISTAYSWDPYYAGFRFKGTTQGFKAASTAVSLGVDASQDATVNKGWKAWSPTWAIHDAFIVPDETKLNGQTIQYQLSADNGSHWESVNINQSYIFQNPGHILRWKAVLNSNSETKTVAINTLYIKFNRLYSTAQVFTAGMFETKWPIMAVQPMWNGTKPVGTDIAVSVSNNNGTTWTPVANGACAILPWAKDDGIKNTQLKWKAEFTSNGLATPSLKNITINYIQSMFPHNVKVRVGDLPDPVWKHDGYFLPADDGTQAIDGDKFYIDLNYILPHLEQGNMTIKLNVTSDTAGVIHFSALSVEYGKPPNLSQPIGPQTIDENSGTHNKLIDLNAYFTDEFDTGKLGFEIPFQEDPSKVKAWIEEKHYFSVQTVKTNWFGQVRFVVRAINSVGLKTQSNTFTVNVANVNQPPTLIQPPDFTLTVGKPFEYQLQFTDPDIETYTYTITPPVLTVDATSGKISMTPTQAQIGNFTVTYMITDKGGLSDTKTGHVLIEFQNSLPALNQIGPQFPTVNTKFTYQVTATDPDLKYGTEALTYTLKTDTSGVPWPTGMTIDAKTGLITWTPKAPGMYGALVTVTDKTGASASESVTFTVLKVNTPPHDLRISSPKETQAFNTTNQILFQASATDDDLGDTVKYTWYDGETQFGVGASFRTVLLKADKHTIKVVATDGKPGHDVSRTVNITMKQGPTPTVTTQPVSSEKRIVAGIPDSLFMLCVLLGAVVAVIAVASIYGRGGSTRKKLKQLEAEMKGPAQQNPPK